MRRLIAPVIAAIFAALVLATVASWADFGDATLTGVAGFIGGVLAVGGGFYAFGSSRERPRSAPRLAVAPGVAIRIETHGGETAPDASALLQTFLQGVNGVQPDEAAVTTEERHGSEVASRESAGSFGGSGGNGGVVIVPSPPVVVPTEGAQRANRLRIEGSVEPVKVAHP